MIGYFITKDIIADSKGNVYKAKESSILSILLSFNYRRDTNMFYNLDDCVSALLNIINITKEQAIELRDKEQVKIKEYTITYYPNKLFTIDYGEGFGHPFVVFYDASQYMSEAEQTHQESYTPEECKKLAIKTEQVGLKVKTTFAEIGLNSNKVVSPVAAFKDEYSKLNIPTYKDVPIEVTEMASNCIKGSWFDTFKLGHFENTYDYDINAAYASELYNLMDLRCGEWEQSVEIPQGAIYGFTFGEFETDSPFHPFITKNRDNKEDNTTYSAVGKWDDYMTLQEIQLMKKFSLGNFTIKDGYWWIPNKHILYPFRTTIEKLFQNRANSNDWLVRKTLQRTMAGMWGKLLEMRKGELGEFFNPVYGCIVETNTRLKVATMCMQEAVVPISVAVDGILTDKPISLVYIGTGIGEWKISNVGKAIAINPTMIAIKNKSKNGQFSLDYDWLVESINKEPEAKQYSITGYNVVSLADALERDNISLIGTIEKVNRNVNIEPNNKRLWGESINTGKELLNTQLDSFGVERNMLDFD